MKLDEYDYFYASHCFKDEFEDRVNKFIETINKINAGTYLIDKIEISIIKESDKDIIILKFLNNSNEYTYSGIINNSILYMFTSRYNFCFHKHKRMECIECFTILENGLKKFEEFLK